MPPKQSPRKSWLRKLWLFFAAACALLLAAGLIYAQQYLTVESIQVSSPKKDIRLTGLENYMHKNILLVPEEGMAQELYDRNPLIKRIEIRKEYPNTLRVVLALHTPFAQLVADRTNFILSEDGRILAKQPSKKTGLPVINYYQKLNTSFFAIGDTITYKDILDTLKFTGILKNAGLEPQSVDISSPNMIACTLKEGVVLFSSARDFGLSQYQFEKIYRQLKGEGKMFKSLDLRFDKPVIKF